MSVGTTPLSIHVVDTVAKRHTKQHLFAKNSHIDRNDKVSSQPKSQNID